MDADALLEGFVASLVAVGRYAPKTARNYRLYVRGFLAWWGGRGELAAVTLADLHAYLTAETARGVKPATRQSIVNGLRAFFRHLHETEVIDHDPTERLTAPRVPPPRTEIYRRAEIAAILAHTARLPGLRGRQTHAITATFRYTGLRVGELAHLALADLDLAARRAEVRGKGARHRLLVLPRPLADTLTGFLADTRPDLPASSLLFANPDGHEPAGPFTVRALYDEVLRAGVGAGVPGRHHPHKWRHTFATELLRAGVDLHTVQRLLGHTTVASTVRYTHLADDDLRRSLDTVF